jgi:VCBS repeat-containing protein
LSNARGGSDVLAVVVANESDGSDVVVRVEIYGSNDQKLAEKDLIASEAVDS